MPTNRKQTKERVSPQRACDRHIQETLILTNRMLDLADRGDLDREDAGCGVLYGILRDAAYKLKKAAEKEILAHKRKGWWTTYEKDMMLSEIEPKAGNQTIK